MPNRLRTYVLTSAMILLTVPMVSSVEAVSVSSKPSAPQIVSIIASKTSSSKKVIVTVAFTKATTNARSPLLYTEVKIGSASCRALKNASKCTLKNISSKKVLQVFARAKNRNGFGGYGSRISFTTTAGNKWNRNTTNGGGSPAATSPVLGSSLKFNLRNAVGLTLRSNVSSMGVRKTSTGSNLQIIDSNGVASDAVVSGNASIRHMLISPNNSLFVVFNSRTLIGSVNCLLAEIDRQTGDPICIDSSLSSIQWTSSGGGARVPRNPIQFDSSGAIYYVGTTSTSTVLRKYSNGNIADLVNDNINVFSFLVRGDGTVFVYGQTKTSLSSWVRKFSQSGAVTNLSTGSMAISMFEMPDDHVWLGLWNSEFGIRRFSISSGTMVPGYLLSSTQAPSLVDAQNLSFCVGGNINRAFCGWDGTHIQALYQTQPGVVYAVAGTGSDGILMRYYPSFSKATSVVSKVSISQQVLSYVILSGLNSMNQNVTTLYNTNTDSEVTLIPGTSEIEVYRLNYVASSNKIMFDGLRFSDNKYVLGQVDLNTMNVTTSQTGSSKLVDFQTFGS